ncbi:MAG: enoyl-CoA hydratase [Betaproteobacteria bacterium]|nr:enoyl-CoA hydratase [Betaproteobacteria bacterium]
MMEPLVKTERQGSVARITLNRPHQFNALSEGLIAELRAALRAAGADEQVRVVVLAAEGRAFCAGHDLKEMRAAPSLGYYQQLFADCAQMMLEVVRNPVPVIARVQGIATAAGCQLVAMCDLAVASADARFAVSGVNYGLFCSTPAVALSRNVSRKQAMEMLLTGEFISADEAVQRGLINHAVPADQLDAAVQRLVDSITAKPRVAVAMGKQLFYKQLEMGIDAAYQLAGNTMACNMMDDCALEGVLAFTEKRNPNWR